MSVCMSFMTDQFKEDFEYPIHEKTLRAKQQLVDHCRIHLQKTEGVNVAKHLRYINSCHMALKFILSFLESKKKETYWIVTSHLKAYVYIHKNKLYMD